MGKTVAGEPTGLTAERYAEVPDHPLNGVPQDVLDAARVPMCEALTTKDVNVENAYPLADAVLSAALPALLRWWTQDTLRSASWVDTRVTWYDVHDHEDGNGPHGHSIYDHHAGALLPRTHDGVGQFIGTATEARSRWKSSAPIRREDIEDVTWQPDVVYGATAYDADTVADHLPHEISVTRGGVRFPGPTDHGATWATHWYDMHDHDTPEGRHAHSVDQPHESSVTNPRANDHTGVEVFYGTVHAAQARWSLSSTGADVSVGDNSDRPGASHYSAAVQPIDLIDSNDMGFYEGSVVKYVTRWVRKNGLEDLEKAVWYLNRLLDRARAARSVGAEDGGTGAA